MVVCVTGIYKRGDSTKPEYVCSKRIRQNAKILYEQAIHWWYLVSYCIIGGGRHLYIRYCKNKLWKCRKKWSNYWML